MESLNDLIYHFFVFLGFIQLMVSLGNCFKSVVAFSYADQTDPTVMFKRRQEWLQQEIHRLDREDEVALIIAQQRRTRQAILRLEITLARLERDAAHLARQAV